MYVCRFAGAMAGWAGIHSLWRPRWACLPLLFGSGEKYCHNGDMAFAHHLGAGFAGSDKPR